MMVSILVRYSIGRETRLNDFGGITASYLSEIHIEQLDAGDTTECTLGMIFVTWCIFKLDCYVTLCHACLVLIVANNIIHLWRKMVSWSCGVCDVTMTSEFSDHI